MITKMKIKSFSSSEMTRCKYCYYNNQLKSSAYNPTGQCYELQLAAYNAMTNHLRRVLLAKSVVDSGKTENRVFGKRNVKSGGKRLFSKRGTNLVKESLSQNVIDRLAYDTKHHPHEVASMNWGAAKRGSAEYNSKKEGNRSNSTDSSEDSSLRNHNASLKNYSDKFGVRSSSREVDTRSSPPRGRVRALNRGKKNHKTDSENRADNSGESEDFADMKKFGKSDREYPKNVRKSSSGSIPGVTSSSEISSSGTPEFVASFLGSTSNINSDVSMYVEFVYDITKEVMDRGYYSDHEIERVFQKHLKRNLGRLNKNKMLREINCLKRALNINYDSEGEEEEAEETLGSTCSVPRLRQNPQTSKETSKIIEKQIAISKKTDRPAEIVVTKEDVLTTLLEMDLNPAKAEEICKCLENRSKEVILGEINQVRGHVASADFNAELSPRYYCEPMSPTPKISISFQSELNKENIGGTSSLSWNEKSDTNSEKQLDPPHDDNISLKSELSGLNFSESSSKANRKDRGGSQEILMRGKIDESDEESSPRESSDKVEAGDLRRESKKEKINKISKSSESEHHPRALEKDSSSSNQALRDNDSPIDQGSAAACSLVEINKVEGMSDDSRNDKASEFKNAAAASNSKKKPKGNDDPESNAFHIAPEIERKLTEEKETLNPEKNTKTTETEHHNVS